MGKTTKMGLISDFKSVTGKWAKSISKDNMQWTTISYRRWDNINRRCDYKGSLQKREPTYIGCENTFKDFQEFVEWSRLQVGYADRSFQIDKDLLFKGNKIYSPSTCIFIPHRINSLLITRGSKRGDFPVGVCFAKHASKFQAQCADGKGKSVYIGLFNTPEEAFYAYKVFKENLMKQVAEEYKDVIDIRAYNALKSYQVEIDD